MSMISWTFLVLSDAPSGLSDAVSLGARTHIISLYDYVIKSVSIARLDIAGVVRDTFLFRVSLRLGCNFNSYFCTIMQLQQHSAVPLNVEHELTRQRKWDKQETQEYMRHFNALKLDKLTSDPR